MGVRPKLMLLCGIDDLRVERGTIVDSRLVHPEKLDARYETPLELAGLDSSTRMLLTDHKVEPSRPYDVADLFHHDDEFGLPSVAGYVWDYLPSSDTVYALTTCFPEFKEPGYRVLPTVPEAEDISGPNWELRRLREDLAQGRKIPREDLKRILRSVRYKRLAHRYDQNYAGGFDLDFNWRHPAALEVFKQAGFEITRAELKMMLYWQWS